MIKPMAMLVLCALAGSLYAQNTVASASDVAATPDSNQSSGGGAAASNIGEPPTPVTTTELPYPRLTGIWAKGPLSPSLSEQFNEKLPSWLRFSGELRERFSDYS